MEPMGHSLPQPQLDAIAAACQQHQVRRMHLFGSALRDDFDPSRSDLDLLVEFQPIAPGALVQAYFGLEQQLTSITGQSVSNRVEGGQARSAGHAADRGGQAPDVHAREGPGAAGSLRAELGRGVA